MIKGVKIRFEIHNILFSIYKFNKTLNSSLIKKQINKQKKEDIGFLYNVTLNSMRLHLHCLKIIDKFIKKKIKGSGEDPINQCYNPNCFSKF